MCSLSKLDEAGQALTCHGGWRVVSSSVARTEQMALLMTHRLGSAKPPLLQLSGLPDWRLTRCRRNPELGYDSTVRTYWSLNDSPNQPACATPRLGLGAASHSAGVGSPSCIFGGNRSCRRCAAVAQAAVFRLPQQQHEDGGVRLRRPAWSFPGFVRQGFPQLGDGRRPDSLPRNAAGRCSRRAISR